MHHAISNYIHKSFRLKDQSCEVGSEKLPRILDIATDI